MYNIRVYSKKITHYTNYMFRRRLYLLKMSFFMNQNKNTINMQFKNKNIIEVCE